MSFAFLRLLLSPLSTALTQPERAPRELIWRRERASGQRLRHVKNNGWLFFVHLIFNKN